MCSQPNDGEAQTSGSQTEHESLNAVVVLGLSVLVSRSLPPNPLSTSPPEPLVRLVRLTLRPDARVVFLHHFDASAPKIRAFEGCRRLELWQGQRFPNVCTTFSLWTGEAALERYRRSALFRETWQQVKPLFAAPPVAHSHAVLRAARTIDAAAGDTGARRDPSTSG